MKKTDYYAIVNYRGRERIYYISAEENKNIRVEYVDYKPERYSEGVWIINGKERIVQKFDKKSKEHKYYTTLKEEFKKQVEIIRKEQQRIWNVDYIFLGTDYYKKAFNKALKLIP
jgi:hypothetical protein